MSIYNKNNLVIHQATATNSTRPEINGVLFKKDRSVATDSYVLIEVVNPEEMTSQVGEYPELPDGKPLVNFPKKGVIIPAKSVKKVKSNLADVKNKDLPILSNAIFLLPKKEGASQIATTDLERADIVSVKNTEGDYPEYNQVMPKDGGGIKMTLDLKKLKQVVDILSAMDLDSDHIDITVRESEKPFEIKLKTKQNQDVTALVMPIKN